MYFFYADETGNTGNNLEANDQPIHWICALAIPVEHLQAIDLALYRITDSLWGSHLVSKRKELHGSDILHGRGLCGAFSPTQRIQLYDALMALLQTYQVAVFGVGVDKIALAAAFPIAKARPHPHVKAFTELAAILDGWLARQQLPDNSPCLGLFVADEHQETRDILIQHLTSWRRDSKQTTIRHLVDTIHYVPSHESRLMQLADCVTYMIGRVARLQRTKDTSGETYTASEQVIVTLWTRRILPCIHSLTIDKKNAIGAAPKAPLGLTEANPLPTASS